MNPVYIVMIVVASIGTYAAASAVTYALIKHTCNENDAQELGPSASRIPRAVARDKSS